MVAVLVVVARGARAVRARLRGEKLPIWASPRSENRVFFAVGLPVIHLPMYSGLRLFFWCFLVFLLYFWGVFVLFVFFCFFARQREKNGFFGAGMSKTGNSRSAQKHKNTPKHPKNTKKTHNNKKSALARETKSPPQKLPRSRAKNNLFPGSLHMSRKK